jgi:molybdopterin/thiamine biosynthesis adenylyltransferase
MTWPCQNLHRQTLFTEADIGTPKVTAAARALTARNSACTVVAHPVTLGPETVAKLCHDATLVLDCADSFAASYVLSDHCLNADLPLISASALGFGGYVGGFCGGAPSLRAVFPDLPDRAASCDTGGGDGAGRRHDRCRPSTDGAGLPPWTVAVPFGAVDQL